MTDHFLSANLAASSFRAPSEVSVRGKYEWVLQSLILTAFLPEGLSLIIGDFRLPAVRILLILALVPATVRFLSGGASSITLASDRIVILAGTWMILAGVATDGLAVGLKGAGASALEFVGAYCVVRRLLGERDGSVRLVRFAFWVMLLVTMLALLDPLTKHLFVQDLINKFTGYQKPYNLGSGSFFRNGMVRAMGPMEHSILFGSACAWFGILALCTLRFSRFSLFFASVILVGLWFSQSRAPLVAFIAGVALVTCHFNLSHFKARWKVMMWAVGGYVLIVFCFSDAPVSSLLRYGGVDPEAGWYRQMIWQTAGPLVLQSPMFGLGLSDNNWDWQNAGLAGPTVDSLWLRNAMLFGIPGSLLIFLTLISPFWSGSLEDSPFLSTQEKRLSAALGIVTATIVFLGFTVHFWGTCWILLGAFPAIRAHLVEASMTRAGVVDD